MARHTAGHLCMWGLLHDRRAVRIQEEEDTESSFVRRCSTCGAARGDGPDLCTVCGSRLDHDDPREYQFLERSVPAVAEGQIGLVVGIVRTFGDVLFQPLAFFSSRRMDTGIMRPFFFGLSIRFLFYLLALGVTWMISGIWPPLVAIPGGLMDATLEMFLVSGLVHLSLKTLGGASGGFPVTFNALAYTKVAAIVSPIPLVGWYLYAILMCAFSVVAVSRSHEIPAWKAMLAVLMPGLLFCLLLAILMSVQTPFRIPVQ